MRVTVRTPKSKTIKVRVRKEGASPLVQSVNAMINAHRIFVEVFGNQRPIGRTCEGCGTTVWGVHHCTLEV